MKLIIDANKQITLEVQPNEGQKPSFAEVAGILDYVKSLVINQWHSEMAKANEEVSD